LTFVLKGLKAMKAMIEEGFDDDYCLDAIRGEQPKNAAYWKQQAKLKDDEIDTLKNEIAVLRRTLSTVCTIAIDLNAMPHSA
jgi:hypothetical protein